MVINVQYKYKIIIKCQISIKMFVLHKSIYQMSSGFFHSILFFATHILNSLIVSEFEIFEKQFFWPKIDFKI